MRFGVRFTYRVQERPAGIADALLLADGFIDDEVAIILGDNIFEHTDVFQRGVSAYLARNRPPGAHIFLKQVPDPERFGIAEIVGNELRRIVEKPREFIGPYAVTGLYLLDHRCFEIARGQKPSARGELEITDVLNVYLARNELKWTKLDGFWSDAGQVESLFRATLWAREQRVRASPVISGG